MLCEITDDILVLSSFLGVCNIVHVRVTDAITWKKTSFKLASFSKKRRFICALELSYVYYKRHHSTVTIFKYKIGKRQTFMFGIYIPNICHLVPISHAKGTLLQFKLRRIMGDFIIQILRRNWSG